MAGDNIDDLVRCLAKVWPCWANRWVTCGSVVVGGKCERYGHRRG